MEWTGEVDDCQFVAKTEDLNLSKELDSTYSLMTKVVADGQKNCYGVE